MSTLSFIVPFPNFSRRILTDTIRGYMFDSGLPFWLWPTNLCLETLSLLKTRMAGNQPLRIENDTSELPNMTNAIERFRINSKEMTRACDLRKSLVRDLGKLNEVPEGVYIARVDMNSNCDVDCLFMDRLL
ncbi:hypothetical protein ACJJTC_008520 [Scirpophaga incertulas]